MSCDTKILCKALAKIIETYIPNHIMNDQNGFVLGRQAFHNIRRVLNIVYKKQNAKDHAILSLDAEKAFYRIEWRYLFEVLKRFGLGDGYIKWIKLLYNDPQAEIITNNQISKPFNLSRGTRQGCPLSPLLFLFAVEPLFRSPHSLFTGFRSEDWNGHSRSLVLCPVTHFCAVFEVCVWIIVRLEDPNMAHCKISNRVSHLISYLLIYAKKLIF